MNTTYLYFLACLIYINKVQIWRESLGKKTDSKAPNYPTFVVNTAARISSAPTTSSMRPGAHSCPAGSIDQNKNPKN